MAFPDTAVLDNFNRAAEGPPPSANWTLLFGVGSKTDGTSYVRGSAGTSGDNGSYWNVQTFGPDTEAFVKVTTVPGAADLYLRLANVPGATTDGYDVSINAASNLLRYYRVDNAVFTLLGSTESQTISNGDSWGGTIIGSTLQIYYKVGAGAWTAMGTGRTDSTYSAAGYIGVTLDDDTGQLDDFGGGTITVSPPMFRGS